MPYDRVKPDVILAATKKLLDIRGGAADPDDRDSLANQVFYGPEDFFPERVIKDSGGIGRRILWRSTFKGKLAGVPSGALSPQMESVLLNSGMGAPLEEINPFEIMDQNLRVLRLGEGGIPSAEAIPDEARGVHPSQFGFVDPYRGPESERLGVDTRLTINTYKGSDNQIYTDLMNVRTGKVDKVSAPQAAQLVIAFPGEMRKEGRKVRAMARGKLEYVDKAEVDYELPHATAMFNASVNMVPMLSATQGGRLLLAGKMFNQALPLQNPEAPLVQAESPEKGVSFDELAGERLGAIRAAKPGVVVSTRGGSIKVSNHDGTTSTYELYQNVPLNRKTYLNNTAVVRTGDVVTTGGLLARSNFTNDQGSAAVGTNLRVAFMPYKGLTYEDAYVISESAAKKLTSEHMYTPSIEFEDDVQGGLHRFVSLFPTKYNREQLRRFDEDGVVKPGTVLQKDDPVILATGKAAERTEGQWLQKVRTGKPSVRDKSVTWEHDFPGEVVDVVKGKDGLQVAVKAYVPMQVGDKMSARYGDKGVVAKIIPDDKMPKDKAGQPFDVIQNPLTLPTRLNPGQVLEMQLAKIARKTGRPYKIQAFMDESLVDYVDRELKRHGLSDTDTIHDPEEDRDIKDVLTGEKFFMKLHHTAEGKWSARETGSYTAEDLPAKGGRGGAKTIANLGMNALISHGAMHVLQDAKLVRGQKNEDYWRTYRQGYAPPSPKVPLVYKKFIAHLQGAGINVKKEGNALHILAMTDKDVEKVSRGAITNPGTLRAKDMKPVAGGLFDRSITGGPGGQNWNHIDLVEPMPSPVMEEPIRRLLGLTRKQFEEVVAGRREINGKTGGVAIKEALARINMGREISALKIEVERGTGARRDAAIKKLGYLQAAQAYGLHPSDWVVTKVPVLPANYRPISSIPGGTQVVADANYLYQDLLHGNEALEGVSRELGVEGSADERLNLYKAFKAIAGLGDPIHPKLQQQNVGGLLKHVFGKSSPKFGQFQRRVLGASTDFAARGVITPNPSLDMDQVGLPEEQAWTLYKPFVIRRLVRKGMRSTDAAQLVEGQDPRARVELMDEMEDRPVVINRAPTLHRYGMMAAYPVLVKGHTLQVSPIVTGGFGADFNGDSCLSDLVPVYIDGEYHLGSFEELVRDYIDITYREETAVVVLGRQTTILPIEPSSDVRVLGVGTDGEAAWLKVAAITIHTSHGPQCYRITTTAGMDCVFTAHHNVWALDADCNLVPAKTGVLKEGSLFPQMFNVPVIPAGMPHLLEGRDTQEVGYWLGYYLADGSLTGRADTVSQASADTDQLAILEAIGNELIGRNGWVEGNGKSVRWTSVPWYNLLLEHTGKNADGKKLAGWMLGASEEFRIGLVAGYFDGEGNVQPRCARVECVNRRLLLGIRLVLSSLGISSSVRAGKKASGNKKATWVLRIHRNRFIKRVGGVSRKLTGLSSRECSHEKWDRVPFPATLKGILSAQGRKFRGGGRRRPRKGKVPCSKQLRKSLQQGYCPRAFARKVIDGYDLRSCPVLLVENWIRIVDNEDMLWDTVERMEQVERPDVTYDFSVEGTESFSIDGTFLTHNTMSYHVPVSDEAVRDARQKMLPSKNLLSVREFDVHYVPSQEYLLGLYQATTKRSRRKPTVFATKDDAIRAYRRGEIGLGDQVVIKGEL